VSHRLFVAAKRNLSPAPITDLLSDNETFDLAGKNYATIERAVTDAFRQPFDLAATIRLTFVTGAGKLGRQKYDEAAARGVTGPLRDLGYEDDAGGGAGTFKQQHDTGKNLKTVVVYPKVAGVSAADMEGLNLGGGQASLIPEGTPEHKIAFASGNTFDRMITSMCPSWWQKKGCLTVLEDLNATVQRLDGKLMTGTPLEEAEQEFYDEVSVKALAEKTAKVKDLMQKQVEKGELTSDEKKFLLQQVSDRIEKLRADLAQAEAAKKTKRVEVLQTNVVKAQERKDMLGNLTTKRPHPLKQQGDIAKLRIELSPLLQLEASAKGRLMSIKETLAMARKEQIEADIVELEENSRGWFESDESFEARVQASRIATKPTAASKKAAAKPVASAAKTSWVIPGAKKKAATKTASKSKAKGGGSVFQAMMMDSDSD
jgi:hypothetical protein